MSRILITGLQLLFFLGKHIRLTPFRGYWFEISLFHSREIGNLSGHLNRTLSFGS